MTDDFKTQLQNVKDQYYLDAGGGISLPVAGAIYWIALAALSRYLPPADWALTAAALSGMIFPLGLLLQKPLLSPLRLQEIKLRLMMLLIDQLIPLLDQQQ